MQGGRPLVLGQLGQEQLAQGQAVGRPAEALGHLLQLPAPRRPRICPPRGRRCSSGPSTPGRGPVAQLLQHRGEPLGLAGGGHIALVEEADLGPQGVQAGTGRRHLGQALLAHGADQVVARRQADVEPPGQRLDGDAPRVLGDDLQRLEGVLGRRQDAAKPGAPLVGQRPARRPLSAGTGSGWPACQWRPGAGSAARARSRAARRSRRPGPARTGGRRWPRASR